MSREERRIETFIEETNNVESTKRWVDSSYEVEGPHFTALVALAVCNVNKWNSSLRIAFLKRLLITAHVRSIHSTPPSGGKVSSKVAKEWSVYKAAAIYWMLIDQLYNVMFKVFFVMIFLFTIGLT